MACCGDIAALVVVWCCPPIFIISSPPCLCTHLILIWASHHLPLSIVGVGVVSCPPLLFVIQAHPLALLFPPPMHQPHSLQAVACSRGVWCCGMGQVPCHRHVIVSSWTMLAPYTRYPPHEQLLMDVGWVLLVHRALEKVVGGALSV